MFRFSIIALGCKANQYDAQALAQALADGGLTQIFNGDQAAEGPADLVVVATCCVTTMAMRKSRLEIRKAVRKSPHCAVLVAGCYCDYDTEKIHTMLDSLNVSQNRRVVAGHHDNLKQAVQQAVALVSEKLTIVNCQLSIDQQQQKQQAETTRGQDVRDTNGNASIKSRRLAAIKRNSPGTEFLPPILHFPDHQRAFVKIQDGCDAFCAYCVVPYTRSRLWSRTIDDVEQQCRQLVATGHKEIVLSGVFLGAFGRPTAIRRNWPDEPLAQGLPALLRRLGQIDGLWKIRLSSLEPLDADDALLDACVSIPNFAPHFHLPLQSGSDRILRRMNRQYRTDDFRRAVDRIAGRFDAPAITTDIIVGFPGETDGDFTQTLEMTRYAAFSQIHAFAFSAIEGTAAWTYRHEMPTDNIVKARLAELGLLEKQLWRQYAEKFTGRSVEALVESTIFAADSSDFPQPLHNNDANSIEKFPVRKIRQAVTDRYLAVRFADNSTPLPAGELVTLQITAHAKGYLMGRIVP